MNVVTLFFFIKKATPFSLLSATRLLWMILESQRQIVWLKPNSSLFLNRLSISILQKRLGRNAAPI